MFMVYRKDTDEPMLRGVRATTAWKAWQHFFDNVLYSLAPMPDGKKARRTDGSYKKYFYCKRIVVPGQEPVKPMRLVGHKLTLQWSGERGSEASSTGFCTCGWSECCSSQEKVREEYRHHIARKIEAAKKQAGAT